jgi:hypothetical protein
MAFPGLCAMLVKLGQHFYSISKKVSPGLLVYVVKAQA